MREFFQVAKKGALAALYDRRRICDLSTYGVIGSSLRLTCGSTGELIALYAGHTGNECFNSSKYQ